jgi:uncharacterized protein YhdP
VGLGTFLAQVLLSKQMAAAGTQEFRVTGPWSEPNVERIQGKAAPGPVAPPASAASAAGR